MGKFFVSVLIVGLVLGEVWFLTRAPANAPGADILNDCEASKITN